MSSSLVGHVLKTLMFKKNIKTTHLARDLDLPQQTLQRIVSGASPNPHVSTLKPIADFFNISLEQLKGLEPLPDFFTDSNLLTIHSKLKVKHLPLIKWDSLESYIMDPLNYSANEHVVADQAIHEKAFSLELNDSSMEPYFPKGALLIFDPSRLVKDRSFVLVKIAESNAVIFRQLLIDGEYRYLKPLNPDLNTFQMRLLKGSDIVLGVMVEFRHRYDDL